MKYKFLIMIIAAFAATSSFSQNENNDMNDNQLNTVSGIMRALYSSISGAVGQQRNWSSFENLFAPDARMYIAVSNGSGTQLKSITPADYEQRNENRLTDIGFNENELNRITNTYGAGTQVFSTYESHYTNNNGEEDFTKGINNIQLFFDGSRYYIVSIFWDANAKNIQVPQQYLPADSNTDYQINL